MRRYDRDFSKGEAVGVSQGEDKVSHCLSQAFESCLAHIPRVKVVTPGTPYDAKGLLKSAIRYDNPVLFLEGEMLYNTKGEVPEDEYVIPLGQADLKREGDHCTIVTSGKM